MSNETVHVIKDNYSWEEGMTKDQIETSFNGTVKATSLWTNTSPNSDFGTKEITIQSSKFDYYEVFYKNYKNGDIVMSQKSKIGFGTRLYIFSNDMYETYITLSRDVRVGSTNDILIIENCVNQSGTNVDSNLIPIEIVGYKIVQNS